MISKSEMIEIIRAENPTLRIGNDESGYAELSVEEYEAQINEWADARLAKEQAKTDAEALLQNKISAYQKLGLTGAEIEALMPTPKPKISNSASA